MKRIAIVGGGLSGLTCAFELQRRGFNVTVFEAEKRAGGRDVAAYYLLAPDLFQNTFELIKQLGLAGDTISISPHAGQFYKGRVYHHRVSSATGLLSFKGLGLMDKALLPRMAYLLSRHSSQLQFHRPEVGLAFDNESAAAYVKRELSQSVLNYVAGPLISTLFFYGSEETSAWLYLILAKHMSNLQMSTIRGGVGRIAEALTRQLRIVHRPVNQIAVADSSYVVGEDRFSDVVFAIPGNAVLRIGGIETLLSEEDRRFFLATRYQRVVSVQVATETPIDGRCYAVSIPRVERRTASTVSFQDYIDPSSVPLGQGLVTVSGGGPDVTGRQLLGDLEALYPKIHAARVDSWEWASGMAMFPPGRFREIAEFQNRKRRSGLFFCGDYVLGPLVEGAITTGLRVAAAIQT